MANFDFKQKVYKPYVTEKKVEEFKEVKEPKKESKLVKCVVKNNSVNPAWNIGDTVEVPSDHKYLKEGFLEEVIVK